MSFFDDLNAHYDQLAEARLLELIDHMDDPANILLPRPRTLPRKITERIPPIERASKSTKAASDRIAGRNPDAPPLSPRIEDVAPSLGEWTGAIIRNLDYVLVSLNDGEWKGRTREVVIDHVGRVLVDLFAENVHTELLAMDQNELNATAARHLAQHIVVKSLALTIQQNIEATQQ